MEWPGLIQDCQDKKWSLSSQFSCKESMSLSFEKVAPETKTSEVQVLDWSAKHFESITPEMHLVPIKPEQRLWSVHIFVFRALVGRIEHARIPGLGTSLHRKFGKLARPSTSNFSMLDDWGMIFSFWLRSSEGNPRRRSESTRNSKFEREVKMFESATGDFLPMFLMFAGTRERQDSLPRTRNRLKEERIPANGIQRNLLPNHVGVFVYSNLKTEIESERQIKINDLSSFLQFFYEATQVSCLLWLRHSIACSVAPVRTVACWTSSESELLTHKFLNLRVPEKSPRKPFLWTKCNAITDDSPYPVNVTQDEPEIQARNSKGNLRQSNVFYWRKAINFIKDD